MCLSYSFARTGREDRAGLGTAQLCYDLTHTVVRTPLGKPSGVQRTRRIQKVLLLRMNTFLPSKCISYNNFGSLGFISFVERRHIYLGKEFGIAQVLLGKEQEGAC